MSSQASTARPGGVIIIPGDRYFPEGISVANDGTFFVGSMEEGCITRASPGAKAFEPFIPAGANGLVSVLGLYVDEARGLLWACSADAGNGKLTGQAPVGIKAFDLKTGAPRGSYNFPGGGFPNDLTIDRQGNVYVTDSWTPRILRLPTGGSALEEWINDPQLGVEIWSLNGIDYDRQAGVIYTVNQRAGKLFRIAIRPDGGAGQVTLIQTSRGLRRPDGLKVIGPSPLAKTGDFCKLATAEGGAGGMAIIEVSGDTAEVTTVNEGLDCVSTFALYAGSAWVVENQGDHFWDPANAGPDADPPFRIVEVPLP
jgi:sugar lactone lactonase YvrE